MRSDLFDYSQTGKRIKLIHTSDIFTRLRKGDIGTVLYTFDNAGIQSIVIKWDNGSNLMLLAGIDD